MIYSSPAERIEDEERQHVRAHLLASDVRDALRGDAYDSPEIDRYALAKAIYSALRTGGMRLERA